MDRSVTTSAQRNQVAELIRSLVALIDNVVRMEAVPALTSGVTAPIPIPLEARFRQGGV